MIETFFIVVLFTVGGEQKVLDGWHPRQSENYETCQEGVKNIQKYFVTNKGDIVSDVKRIEVSCRTVLVPALEV
tara:strand:+ start:202 stop:423 length:222 start_codon:yes stop_codon:yes gene_type:complete